MSEQEVNPTLLHSDYEEENIIHFRSSITLRLFLPLLRWESKKGLSFKSSREAVTDRFPTFHPSCVSSFCHKVGPAAVEINK